MNVDTRQGVWGKYNKTQHPDGSITLFDPGKGQHVDIALGQPPLTKEQVEQMFADKYAPGDEVQTVHAVDVE